MIVMIIMIMIKDYYEDELAHRIFGVEFLLLIFIWLP